MNQKEYFFICAIYMHNTYTMHVYMHMRIFNALFVKYGVHKSSLLWTIGQLINQWSTFYKRMREERVCWRDFLSTVA